MTDKEAMKLALDALEYWDVHGKLHQPTEEAIAALKERLAQPEQEPVALPCCGYMDASAVKWNPFNGVVQCHNCGQTYTPPQRTEPPQKKVWTFWDLSGGDITDAIKAKLKEKNT
jgi:hypothetical protein